MKDTKQSFFYGETPMEQQKKAYAAAGLKWPPKRRKSRLEAKE